jgi:phenylacetate-CoA ligase
MGFLRTLAAVKLRYLDYKRYCGFLEESQWWAQGALEKYQGQRLRELLEYAYDNVPYYGEVFKKNRLLPSDFKSLDDLRKLPVLRKEDVVSNFDKLIAKQFSRAGKRRHLAKRYTGGSTGTPMLFYHDRRSMVWREAFFAYRNKSAGLNPGDKFVWICSTPFSGERRGSKLPYKFVPGGLMLSSLAPGPQQFEEYLKLINKFQPDYVAGLPSLVYDLACFSGSANGDIRFGVFFSTSENLHNFQKEKIRKQFSCEIFDYYSSQEIHNLACECRVHKGMHVEMRHVVLEIAGSGGQPLPRGERGKILCTGLINRAMPLIRYDTGDVGLVSQRSCSCGRGLALLEGFEGRETDVICYKGRRFYATALSVIVEEFNNIKECQFIQEGERSLRVNIVRSDLHTQNDTLRLVQRLKRLFDDELALNINFVDSIPRGPAGKFKFIINSLKGF